MYISDTWVPTVKKILNTFIMSMPINYNYGLYGLIYLLSLDNIITI